MGFVIEPPVLPSLPVAGMADRFPIRRVFCVGRNYAEHAREMGHNPDREPPFFFTKPADAVIAAPLAIPYPPQTADLQYEIELVVAIGRAGFKLPEHETNSLIFGYAVGLDMTRRDLQKQAKDMGRPWDWGKGFDFSAPCSAVQRVTQTGLVERGSIWLDVNKEPRQRGDIAELIWSIPELLSLLSQSMKLQPGDLVMTGTPAGVGPVIPGDVIKGGVEGVCDIDVEIAPPE